MEETNLRVGGVLFAGQGVDDTRVGFEHLFRFQRMTGDADHQLRLVADEDVVFKRETPQGVLEVGILEAVSIPLFVLVVLVMGDYPQDVVVETP